MLLDAELTLSRGSNADLMDGRTITICVGGGTLGRKAIQIHLTPEDLGLALTGLACIPVKLDLRVKPVQPQA